MATQLARMTADELLALPHDGLRRELVDGEVIEMTPAGFRHGQVAGAIHGALYAHCAAHQLGVVTAAETGFRLRGDPDTVRAPDVGFVAAERAAAAGDVEGYWPGAPDLAVEVVSPNDRFAEVDAKVQDWLDAGTRMVIVVNPTRRGATVYRSRTDVAVLDADGVIEGGDVVPGWRLRVGDVFA